MTGKATRSQMQGHVDDGVIAAIKDVLKSKDFLQTLSALIKDAVSSKFEEYMAKQNKISDDLIRETDLLKAGNKSMSDRIDKTEQYSRRNNLRIFGLPEVTGEKVDECAFKLFNETMGLNIPRDAIEKSYRVGLRKPDKNRVVVVNFGNYGIRKIVYNHKKNLKSKGVAIKEDLTASRLNIYKKACETFNYKNVWTVEGVIFIKLENKSYKFETYSSLDEFISRHTVNN